jgi:hypothetical protein
LGLFTQCRLARALDSLERRHIEAETRALSSAFLDSLRVKVIQLAAANYSIEEVLVSLPERVARLEVRHQPTLGVTFAIDKDKTPGSRWDLFLEGGPLPQLTLCTYHGTGFRCPRGWGEDIITSGGANALWIDSKGYWGGCEGDLYLFLKRRNFGRSLFLGVPQSEASEAGLQLRHACRTVRVATAVDRPEPLRLSRWSWQQKRFVRRFDTALTETLGAERLRRILEAMGIDLKLWLSRP